MKAFAGRSLLKKFSKQNIFDQILKVCRFLRWGQATQRRIVDHMQPAGSVLKIPDLRDM